MSDYLNKRKNHILAGRPKEEKKKKFINRKPLKKKWYKIAKTSKKREIENISYFRQREQFLNDHPLCELKIKNVCTRKATCIHHVNGRTVFYLVKSTWKASCHSCNNWVEANDKAARALGLKKSKFKMTPKVLHIRIDSAPGYRSDAIQKGFIENGFEYNGFDWQYHKYNFGTETTRLKIIELAKSFNPTIIFAHVQNEEIFDTDTWKSLADTAFLINYTFDVRYAEKMQWMYELAPHIGHTFFACKEDVRNCEIRGIKNISHMHSSCDMDLFKPKNEKKLYANDCVFVGNRYDNTNMNFPLAEERQEMIAVLEQRYGNRFMSYGLGQKANMILPEAEVNVYNYSRISINQNNFDLAGYSSDRIWRIMASGSFCLTKYFEGIEDVFVKGVHLDWWKTFDELIERIDFYLYNDDERAAIADMGMKYVRENHTWAERVSEMVKICDI